MSTEPFRTYPELAPGQYRRTMPDLYAREALFVRPAWCLSVMWRGPVAAVPDCAAELVAAFRALLRSRQPVTLNA